MTELEHEYEDGRSDGKKELIKKLEDYATSSGNSRVIEIISNAIYFVKDKE